MSPRSRAKVIVRTALGWTAAVALTTITAMLLTTTYAEYADTGLFRLVVNAAIIFGIGLALALIGALVGSELFTLVKWLFRRATD